MLNIKNKLGLCLTTFTILTLPISNIFANESTQASPNTNSATHNTSENLKPYVPPPKEPQKDKITPKTTHKFVLQGQQPAPEQPTETQTNNPPPEPEQKPAETPQKSKPKEIKKQEETIPAEGDSGVLDGKVQTEEQKSETSNIISEIDLPEVDDSEIETNANFIQSLTASNKQDLAKACISFILVISGLFIIIKVIIANFKIPRGYQPSTKNKHFYSKRKKYNYNTKR